MTLRLVPPSGDRGPEYLKGPILFPKEPEILNTDAWKKER
jgi:hypothetical protein